MIGHSRSTCRTVSVLRVTPQPAASHPSSSPPAKQCKQSEGGGAGGGATHTHQGSLSGLLNVVRSDDNGGPTCGDQLYQMLPDPIIRKHCECGIILQSHVPHFARRMGSTPTVGSSRIMRGGCCNMATAKENLLFCPPLQSHTVYIGYFLMREPHTMQSPSSPHPSQALTSESL